MRYIKGFGVIWLLILVAVFLGILLTQEISLTALKVNKNALTLFVKTNYLLSVLVFTGLLIVQVAFSIPGTPIFSLAAGFLFGLFWGTIYVNLGCTIGAVLAFYGARRFFKPYVQEKFGKKLKNLQEGFSKNSFVYLLVFRLNPALPVPLVNFAAGLTHIPIFIYILATSLGMFPGIAIYVYGGKQLSSLNSLYEIFTPSVFISLSLISVLLLAPQMTRIIWAKYQE